MNIANRIALALAGMLLLTVGSTGAAHSQGWIAAGTVEDVVPVQRAWGAWQDIEWDSSSLWVLLAVALGTLGLALSVLVVELAAHPRTRDRIVLAATRRGSTTISTRSLRRAVQRQAERIDGVQQASVDVIGVSPSPRFEIRIRSDARRRLADVGGDLVEQVGCAVDSTLGASGTTVEATIEVRPGRDRTTTRRTAGRGFA